MFYWFLLIVAISTEISYCNRMIDYFDWLIQHALAGLLSTDTRWILSHNRLALTLLNIPWYESHPITITMKFRRYFAVLAFDLGIRSGVVFVFVVYRCFSNCIPLLSDCMQVNLILKELINNKMKTIKIILYLFLLPLWMIFTRGTYFFRPG